MKTLAKNMNRRSIGNRKQKGIGLVEILIGLLISGVIIAAAYTTYQSISQNQERDALKSAVLNVISNAKSVKQQYKSYDGFTNTTVFNSAKMIDDRYRSTTDDQFVTPYSSDGLEFSSVDTATMIDGTVLVGANLYLETVIKDVPESLCGDTVDDFISSVTEVQVGGTRIATNSAKDTACSSVSTTVDITLISQ